MTRLHVELSVEAVVQGSLLLRELVERREIGVVGALCDVETGKVAFLD